MIWRTLKKTLDEKLQEIGDEVYIWLLRLDMQRKGVFRQSSWTSLVLRPMLESRPINRLLAAPLAAAVITGSAMQIPTNDYAYQAWDVHDPLSQLLVNDQAMVVTTEKTLTLPVENLLGISQNFHRGHGGIDMRAPLGSKVVAIASGKVVETTYDNYGYGNKVVVEHVNQQTSLYAHLGEIEVKTGKEVKAGDTLGEVGLTGWTTGPHLHFEVMQNGKVINPVIVIQPALESLVRSTVSN